MTCVCTTRPHALSHAPMHAPLVLSQPPPCLAQGHKHLHADASSSLLHHYERQPSGHIKPISSKLLAEIELPKYTELRGVLEFSG